MDYMVGFHLGTNIKLWNIVVGLLLQPVILSFTAIRYFITFGKTKVKKSKNLRDIINVGMQQYEI